MRIQHILLFLTPLLFYNCETVFFEEETPFTAQAIFDEAWEFADREYSFFEYKEIDWNAVRAEYDSRIDSVMNREDLFDVIADMLFELRDGHVNLRSSFDRSRNWRWFLDYPPNYNFDVLERNYFKEEQQFVGAFIVHDFEDVGYMHYRSFSSTASEGALNYIMEKFKNHKGIIVDIRDNGGGSSGNVTRIARRFTQESILVGRERYRNGIGHNDFSEWENVRLEPYEPDSDIENDTIAYHFTKPVVLLTNRSCYSAASFFTQYMKALPNVTVMGDWTGGGGGAPTFTELANGWILRVSNTQFESPDGFNIEDGIPPDEQVGLRQEDEIAGIDTILEEALAFLRK
ncbi:MAG: S41 family peptidase [Bacteroidota bacterium]